MASDELDGAPAPPPAEDAGDGAMGRRDFLRLAAALGLTWTVGAAGVPRLVAQAVAAQTCTGLARPDLTGLLTEPEADGIWRMFAYIGQRWDTGRFCRIGTAGALRPVLNAKTSATPSYLTEYRRAVAALAQLQRQYGPGEGLRRFFFANPDPCTRQFVVAELVNLQVSQGGFRRFGYVNYAGFVGGPFNDPNHLPYRSYRDLSPRREG